MSAPPFEYSQRATMFTGLDGQMRAAVEEQRDRELEDYLAWLTARTNGGGGGGDVDEVWIGPGVPPGAQELWYDTDEPGIPGQLGAVARRFGVSSSFSTTTVAADITASTGQAPSVTIALSTARLYRFKFNAGILNGGAVGDRIVFELATTAFGVLRNYVIGVPAINQIYGVNIEWLCSPPDNTVQTWKVRARHQGTGPFSMQGVNSSQTMDFLIEDVGTAM